MSTLMVASLSSDRTGLTLAFLIRSLDNTTVLYTIDATETPEESADYVANVPSELPGGDYQVDLLDGNGAKYWTATLSWDGAAIVTPTSIASSASEAATQAEDANTAIAALQAKISGAPIKLVSALLQNGDMLFVAGDAYTGALGRAPQWTVPNYAGPSVESILVTFSVIDSSDYRRGTGSVLASATGSATLNSGTATFSVDIPSSFTSSLAIAPAEEPVGYVYQLTYSYAGATVTIALGSLTVKRAVG